jgi:predicted lipoprotein
VRIGEEDGDSDDPFATWTKTGTGFQADDFVEAIWEESVLTTYEDEAVSYDTVMTALHTDRGAATEQYGLRRETGEPFYVFKVRGTAEVLDYDDSSRNGVIEVLIDGPGSWVATLQVGPVIRGTAIRDSLEFIRFTDIGNQLQFAALANELNARMARDSVEPLDLPNIAGTRISFLGAFRLEMEESLDDVVVTPVLITRDGGAQ